MSAYRVFLFIALLVSHPALAERQIFIHLGAGFGGSEDSDEKDSQGDPKVKADIEFNARLDVGFRLVAGLYAVMGCEASWNNGKQHYQYDNAGTALDVENLKTDIQKQFARFGLTYRFRYEEIFIPFLSAGIMTGKLRLRQTKSDLISNVGEPIPSKHPDEAYMAGEYFSFGYDLLFKFIGIWSEVTIYRVRTKSMDTADNGRLTFEGATAVGGISFAFF